MSKRTIRRKGNPKDRIPAQPTKRVSASNVVPNDPDAVNEEFLRLGHEVRGINSAIRDRQVKVNTLNEEIQAANNQGLQLIGQINMLGKVMRGMGIDPPALDLNPTPLHPQSPPSMEALPGMPPMAGEEPQAEMPPPVGAGVSSKVSQIRKSLRQ